MPVRTTARDRAANTRATEWKSTSTDGRQKFSFGPWWVLRMTSPSCSTDHHVEVSRSDDGTSGRERLTRDALPHRQRRLRRQARRQQRCKDGRHMLRDHDRHGKVGRQRGQKPGQGVGTTGGDSDRHHLHRGKHLRPMKDGYRRGLQDGPCRRYEAGVPLGKMAKSPNLRNEFPGDGLKSGSHVYVTRLGDVIGCAERQSFQRDRGAVLGQAAEHDDGNAGIDFAQLADGCQSVHLRHFEIEEDDVRLEGGELRQSDAPVDRRACDLQVTILSDGQRQCLANHHSIVDQEYSLFCGLRQSARLLFGSVVYLPA